MPTYTITRSVRWRTTAWCGAALACLAAMGAAGGEKAAAPPPTSRATTRPIIQTEPAKVVRRFYASLKTGDVATAKTLIAHSAQPVQDLDKRLARLARSYSEQAWEFSVLDTRETGEVAVAILLQRLADGPKTFEADQWYLVREGEQWKLLAKFQDYELPQYGFEETRVEKYRQLEKWAEERAEQLRKEQPGCQC